jgi:hypothetical protein
VKLPSLIVRIRLLTTLCYGSTVYAGCISPTAKRLMVHFFVIEIHRLYSTSQRPGELLSA